MFSFIGIVLLVLLAFALFGALLSYINSPTMRGRLGEILVGDMLKKLPKNEYDFYENLLLPTENGDTTQIDHVVFSRYGIFVIEVKNYGGWIFAGEKNRVWTQVFYRRKNKFQNPLRQNYKHVKTLQELTGLPEQVFYNLVIFTGKAEFKTNIPRHVFVGEKNCYDFISQKCDILLSESQINDAIVATLGNTRQFEENANKDHVSRLRARHE